MKKSVIKKIALTLGLLTLIGNATPLLAQVVELQILGGGYKLHGPAEISFSPVSTSAFPSTQQSDLRDILFEQQGDGTDLYGMQVIDENGGNPFDVTVTASEIKRNETLDTTTIAGSTGTTLKVASTNGFQSGDTIIIEGVGDNFIFTIDSVVDINTLELEESLGGSINPDIPVHRLVDCEMSPRKCISLSTFSIRNNDGGRPFDVVNGNEGDLSLNTQTDSFTPFKGQTTTINGSSGSTLLVNDTSTFFENENISFPAASGVSPLQNQILSIDNSNTITLLNAFTVAPGSDIEVESTSARTLTLVNGTGLQPGKFQIYPSLQGIIPAGQMPGLYESTLNFTIV